MGDCIELKKGYKLVEVFIARKSSSSVPHIYGCVIIGPRGGKYVLDKSGLEKLVKKGNMFLKNCNTYAELVGNENYRGVVRTEVRENDWVLNNSQYKTREEKARAYAKMKEARFIKSDELREFLKRTL